VDTQQKLAVQNRPYSALVAVGRMEAIMLGNMRLIIGVMIALGMLIVSITGRRERLSLKLGP
jgi:hypothetical protein